MTRPVGGAGLRKRPRQRAGRDVIDPDRITEVALSLLVTEGADQVTMARVARELAVTPRAIYHWVPSRHDLLEAAVRRAQQAMPLPVDSGDWRGDLTRYRDDTFAWLDRHPGIVELSLTEGVTVVSPRVLDAQEAGLGLLAERLRLTPALAHFALSEFSRWVWNAHLHLRQSPGTDSYDQAVDGASTLADLDPEQYPLITAAEVLPIGDQLELSFALHLDSLARLTALADQDSPPRP